MITGGLSGRGDHPGCVGWGQGWTSAGGLAPPWSHPSPPPTASQLAVLQDLDHRGCSPCLPPAAPCALAAFPKEKKPPLHRRPHTGPESGGAEAALYCREMDHELVTFWVAANTSSIPGWPVSGFSKARLPSEQEGHRCSQRQVSLPRAHDKCAPHIPREPCSGWWLLAFLHLISLLTLGGRECTLHLGRKQGPAEVRVPTKGSTAEQSPIACWLCDLGHVACRFWACLLTGPMATITVRTCVTGLIIRTNFTTNSKTETQGLAHIKHSK